ncbi:hypothetical protein SAMN05216267_105717 [Actinacidiphila rubida]|uniref:Uncharacterized protein n=1 Tax=Actinacidiphila rubida TaxID=310780 RepID=A0A1H8TR97_9ACTN|nr:hypothetical protein [Actinacidiphila rubida]SEO93417.1 hypothetical protein SAMN05216267_105717 [Actinacidiphila rubida]
MATDAADAVFVQDTFRCRAIPGVHSPRVRLLAQLPIAAAVQTVASQC